MKKNKGITLIALIVTIIVLLILAGISIGTLTGDNGILGQARIAKEDTEKKGIEEQINVMVIQSTNKRGNIDKEKLIEKLNTLPEGKEIVESDNKIYVLYPEYSFEIDLETGDVTQLNIEISKDETPWELAGSGAESDPFLIESIEDLVAFSNSVNGGNQYNGKYVKLVNTLDFNLPFSYNDPKTKVSEETTRVITENENGTELKTFLTSGTGFNPIGNGTNYFRGEFDGNGKEIKNIYINRPDEDYVGVFGRGVSIKKLGITGEIAGKENVGGIIAWNGSVEGCYNNANIIGKANVGGIAGESVDVKSCYNLGNVKIIAETYNGADYSVGGIVGNAQTRRITKCYNLGKIELEQGFSIGGISGFYGNMYNCYNLGEIKNVKTGKVYYMGGITGSSAFNIERCYNKGIMNYDKANYSGGILGEKLSSTVEILNSYYLKGTAPGGVNSVDTTGQAEPLEESEMPSVIDVVQNQIEVNGEMINVWKEDTNNINNGYPILYWQ